MKKLVLIDGHSLAFRAFYAVPTTMQTKGGLYTNAVFGFTSMLQKILNDLKPDYILVAFDKGIKTFRTEMYAEYKGTRSKMPDEMREQMSYIEAVLDGYRIKFMTLEGYEADDIIGTASLLAEQSGELETIIITGDRDLYQLIAPHTTVYYNRRGMTDILEMDEKAFFEKYGLKPHQLIDVKALMGDSSDNIPGVKGVGEKTALKLICEYQNLDAVYQNIEHIKGKALPARLIEHKDLAYLSYDLAQIKRDVEFEFDINELMLQEVDYDKLYEVFTAMEFNRKLQDLIQSRKGESAPTPNRVAIIHEVQTLDQGQKLLTDLIQSEVYIYFDFHKQKAPLLYVTKNDVVYQVSESVWQSAEWQAFWQDPQANKVVHEFKRTWHLLADHNITLKGVVFDTALAGYVLDPSVAKYELIQLINRYHPEAASYSTEALVNSLALQIQALPAIHESMVTLLQEQQLITLYRDVELPLALVLGQMERNGVAMDKDILLEMGADLNANMLLIERQIYMLAGETFNINSPKQLGVILFEHLKLPVLKKTKTGYSTSQDVLEALALEHDLPAMIISYRQLAKIKSTYIDGMIPLITSEGRLHTTFRQMVTATGRLSSTEPNLQNIPIRTDAGRRIRRAFVAGEGFDYLLAADYSQIELRVLAHMSGDPILIESFKNNEDIHTRTASEVFGVSLKEVTRQMRNNAKAVNFGIVYGQSDYGLSNELHISRKKAGEYIERYFDRYQGVRRYLDQVIVEAKQNGFVETILHRRRYLPEINSRNYHRRSFAERTATNTPIQGSAADLIKLAMINLQRDLLEGEYKSRLLLQVHDELILEVTKEELEKVSDLLIKNMRYAMVLRVPIRVDVKFGVDWYHMEKL